MDISKIMELFGLGNDKPEALEAAMEGEILPEIAGKEPEHGHPPATGGHAESRPAALTLSEDSPEPVQLVEVGRCPSCGDRIADRAEQPCAWCNTPCRPEQDGFHLVHVAIGTFQERHYFCSDDCFEAFRRMYPARVHRNCYERPCNDCDFCVKRYTDEFDGFAAQERKSLAPTAVQSKKD